MAVVDISNTYQLTNVGAHIDNTDVYNSNRNLLDNPWWGSGEVVNQRGFTSGSTAPNVFCIDRWKTSFGDAAGTISLGANGLTITAASGTYALINQVIDNYAKLTGKTVTCSAMLSNGTIVSGTIANLNWDASPIAVTSGNVRLQMLGQGYFRVYILNGGSATIRAVKLELGSYSTLANDVPQDYGAELRKCQRYFVRIKDNGNYNYIPIGNGVWNTGTSSRILIRTPVQMRATPSISRNGTFYVAGNGEQYTVSSIGNNGLSITPEGVFATVVLSATPTIWHTYTLLLTDGSYIDLSADF